MSSKSYRAYMRSQRKYERHQRRVARRSRFKRWWKKWSLIYRIRKRIELRRMKKQHRIATSVKYARK